MARSRRPPTFVISGVLRRVWACRCDSQFPTRMPVDFTLFTRLIPCASSGASKPLSAASAASLRMADILMMIEEDPSPRSSSDTRHALTVALVNPGRGACWNHSINSLSAMLYTRFVMGEETLSSTNAFNFSHCAIFSIAISSFILSPDNEKDSIGSVPAQKWRGATERSGRSASDRIH
jgi:hypothetical protein